MEDAKPKTTKKAASNAKKETAKGASDATVKGTSSTVPAAKAPVSETPAPDSFPYGAKVRTKRGVKANAAGAGGAASAAGPAGAPTAPNGKTAQGAPVQNAPGPQFAVAKSGAKKSQGNTFWKGFLGGICGALVVCLLAFALEGAGILSSVGMGSSQTESSAAGNVIDLDHIDKDASTAEVVAAKCLPSVATINVTTSDSSGVGSGVVYDTDGHIITNYHVIDEATTVSVTLNNQTYDAQVVGFDESSDLAVLKIAADANTLSPMTIGDSSKLVVGEWVMSIGSPFGLDQSVSEGIVSSLYRSTMLQDSNQNTIYTNLIQTDAAINPGNSGGALVNADGELVGINSIIESSSGSSSGVGFAIPSNYVSEIADTIIDGKTVEHPYLGANVMSVTPQLTTRFNLGVNQGAYIDSVVQGSPAANAGLRQGDVIVKVDDEEVSSGDGLILAIRAHHVGDTVTITYYRGGVEQTMQVQLGTDASAEAQQNLNASKQNNQNSNSNQNSQGINPLDLLKQFMQ